MPFWHRSTEGARAPGPGDNVVLASAASTAARLAAITAQLDALLTGQYVIFADHDHVDSYVQFSRNKDGSLWMEVASGAFATTDQPHLADSALAVTTLASLGLTVDKETNFRAQDVTAGASIIANWVEGIFVNLFRADDAYVMDVLTDPARAERTS